MFLQIGNSIHQLHKSGVAHRDIKPENIMLTSNTFEIYIISLVSDDGTYTVEDAELDPLSQVLHVLLRDARLDQGLIVGSSKFGRA